MESKESGNLPINPVAPKMVATTPVLASTERDRVLTRLSIGISDYKTKKERTLTTNTNSKNKEHTIEEYERHRFCKEKKKKKKRKKKRKKKEKN